jgi:hypothetical protein
MRRERYVREGKHKSDIVEVSRIVEWYSRTVYGRHEGPGCTPFFADPSRVGAFAVDVAALNSRDEEALFALLVLMALFQSRRDVDIMRIQRAIPPVAVRRLMLAPGVARSIATHRCEKLRHAETFDTGCSVRRDLGRGVTTCDHRPRTPCHVKDATTQIGRMGDMGMIPTSAHLHIGPGGLGRMFREVCDASSSPTLRADLLVTRICSIRRIGRKLASMYVSALSVPALLPDCAPWCPDVDGARLVVVDANVARIARHLRGPGAATSYSETARWLSEVAVSIDLRAFRREWPASSPRVVQQALYAFGSRSNRRDRNDLCVHQPCVSCPSTACPFTES